MAARPLRNYLKVQTDADKEMARVMERAARDARAQIRRLPRGSVRRAQLERVLRKIKRAQALMWQDDVLGIVTSGREEAVKAAQEAADALTRELWARAPERQAEALDRSFRVSAGEGVGTRRQQRELSARVVGSGKLAQRRLDAIIQSALVRQLNADELAREVYQHISPTVPGGASYAAMRIARTEINNAFHQQQIAQAQRPGVEAVEWNLSGSHKVPDECNVYATKREFPPDKVPDKPHPQCLCYLTYKMADVDDFLAALEAGDFDEAMGVEPVDDSTGPTSSPRVAGTDMFDEAFRNASDLDASAKEESVRLDRYLTEIARRQGWQAPPRVTDRAGVDAAVAAGAVEVFRGVSAYTPGLQRRIIGQLRGDDDQEVHMGQGMYGNGLYFSEDSHTSHTFAAGKDVYKVDPDDRDAVANLKSAKAGTVRAAINPKARTVDYHELQDEWQGWLEEFRKEHRSILNDPDHLEFNSANTFMQIVSDPNRYAALRGYDVVVVRGLDDGVSKATQHIVLNRTVLIMEDQP